MLILLLTSEGKTQGEQVTISPNTPIELDDETADFLLGMKCQGVDAEGNLVLNGNNEPMLSDIRLA